MIGVSTTPLYDAKSELPILWGKWHYSAKKEPWILHWRNSAISKIAAIGSALVFEMAGDGLNGVASHLSFDFRVHPTLLLGRMDSLVDKVVGNSSAPGFCRKCRGQAISYKNTRTRMREMNMQIKLKSDRPSMMVRDPIADIP